MIRDTTNNACNEQGCITPSSHHNIFPHNIFSKGWVAQKLLLIGSLTPALRFSKGWVRKDLNLVRGIGCRQVALDKQCHPTVNIHQRGVQWKLGVVIYMLLYTSRLYNTTPIHCTPLPLHPPLMNTQTITTATITTICFNTCTNFCWKPLRALGLQTYKYMYMYIHMCVYIYIYIYMYKGLFRATNTQNYNCLYKAIYIYIYIYTQLRLTHLRRFRFVDAAALRPLRVISLSLSPYIYM